MVKGFLHPVYLLLNPANHNRTMGGAKYFFIQAQQNAMSLFAMILLVTLHFYYNIRILDHSRSTVRIHHIRLTFHKMFNENQKLKWKKYNFRVQLYKILATILMYSYAAAS